jgi:hypothetical protein
MYLLFILLFLLLVACCFIYSAANQRKSDLTIFIMLRANILTLSQSVQRILNIQRSQTPPDIIILHALYLKDYSKYSYNLQYGAQKFQTYNQHYNITQNFGVGILYRTGLGPAISKFTNTGSRSLSQPVDKIQVDVHDSSVEVQLYSSAPQLVSVFHQAAKSVKNSNSLTPEIDLYYTNKVSIQTTEVYSSDIVLGVNILK